MIGIIDYGMGNLHSVKNACDFLGLESFVSDDENGFTIWNDPRCARFSNSFIAGMILDAAKVEKSAGFMVAREPVTVDGRLCYRIILDNPIPKGRRATGTR